MVVTVTGPSCRTVGAGGASKSKERTVPSAAHVNTCGRGVDGSCL